MNYALFQAGINKYGSGANLQGCVNDVERLGKALYEHSCAVSYWNQLTDKKGTISRLRSAMADAAQQDTDVILVQYSGHGSYLKDKNKDERFSKYDQCLVPVDYSRNGMLTDDELGGIADLALVKSTLVFWLDSCHSGGSSRSGVRTKNLARRMFGVSGRRALPSHLVTGRVVMATRAAACSRVGDADIPFRADTSKFPKVESSHLYVTYTNERHILIAAARAEETAADAYIDGQWQGAGTCALLWAWGQLGNRANYLEVAENANVWLDRNGYSQRICLEGKPAKLQRPFLT